VHSPTDAQKLHKSLVLTQPDLPGSDAGVTPVAVVVVAPATVVVVAPAAVVVVAPAAVVVVAPAAVVVVAPAAVVVAAVVAPATVVAVPVEAHPLFAVLTMHEPVFDPALATVQPHVPHALPQVTFMKNGLELQLPAVAHSQHCVLVSVHVPVDVVPDVPVFDVPVFDVPVFDVPVPVVGV